LTTFKSAAELPESTREAVHALLLAVADSKLFLGFHYGEWTFGTPALEASIAACSMSQDEFGHLRLLHACLNTQFDDHPHDLLERRAFSAFANVPSLDQPLQHWADFVAVNFLTDGALTVLLTALQRSAFEPVANFVDKMVEEEKHHVRNAQGWFNSLATANAHTKAGLEEACRRVLAATLEWLGPAEHKMMATLKNDGIINTSWQDLTQRFMDWIGPLTAQRQMDVGLEKQGTHWRLKKPIDFGGWNVQTRRCTASRPQEQLLYHLRGSKNAIFKLGDA
jgi:phenylacetate-CoA oxygenase PaaI subunit